MRLASANFFSTRKATAWARWRATAGSEVRSETIHSRCHTTGAESEGNCFPPVIRLASKDDVQAENHRSASSPPACSRFL